MAVDPKEDYSSAVLTCFTLLIELFLHVIALLVRSGSVTTLPPFCSRIVSCVTESQEYFYDRYD